jgi:hypothetical protein
MKISRFTGINNVLPQERLLPEKGAVALTEALNVDVNNDGQLQLRAGLALHRAGAYTNVFEAPDFLLAVNAAGDLVTIDGGVETVVAAAVGSDRLWYSPWPDGRVAYSNGLVSGVVGADGASRTDWGVRTPTDAGLFTDFAGDLYPGDYRISLSYVRTSDGREGSTFVSPDTVAVVNGGVMLTGLPTLAGHTINVYLTGGQHRHQHVHLHQHERHAGAARRHRPPVPGSCGQADRLLEQPRAGRRGRHALCLEARAMGAL